MQVRLFAGSWAGLRGYEDDKDDGDHHQCRASITTGIKIVIAVVVGFFRNK